MRCPTLNELPPPPPGKTGWPWTEESPQLPNIMPDGRSWPRVSIVTPSYNQGQFIEETIRSVLLQGYPNLEYIIIDGGSTDGSVDIIRKYEKWLAYWVSEPDRGQSEAINKGWRRAHGKILAWLNSDDLYALGAVEWAVRFLSDHPQAAVAHGRSEIVDSRGTRSGKIRGAPFDLLETLRTGINPIAQPSTFIRRFPLDRVGMTNPTLHMSMDWDLWIRIGLQFDIVFVPEVWSCSRFHPFAKTVSQVQGFGLDKLRILDKVYKASELPPQINRIRAEVYASAHFIAANGFYLADQFDVARYHWWKALSMAPWMMLRRGKGLALRLLLNPQIVGIMRRMKRRLMGTSLSVARGGTVQKSE